MSYEQACEQLYNERLSQKEKLMQARDKFRQQVLDRQNKNVQHNGVVKSEYKSEMVVDATFRMPDVLPANENQLKYLIFQNIELIQNNPARKAESQLNIKRIKAFINEQKK